MGSGIAQWFASRGMDVLLRDVDAGQLAQGLQRAEKLFSDARRRGLLSAAEAQAGMDRIVPAEVPVEMKSIDLVVEAAVEKMESEKANLCRSRRADTSRDAPGHEHLRALSDGDQPRLAASRTRRWPSFLQSGAPDETCRGGSGGADSGATVDTAVAFVQRIGKLPVVVRDRPGFLVNRILLPYLLEAVRLV